MIYAVHDLAAFVGEYDLFGGFVVDVTVFGGGIQYFFFHGGQCVHQIRFDAVLTHLHFTATMKYILHAVDIISMFGGSKRLFAVTNGAHDAVQQVRSIRIAVHVPFILWRGVYGVIHLRTLTLV